MILSGCVEVFDIQGINLLAVFLDIKGCIVCTDLMFKFNALHHAQVIPTYMDDQHVR